MRSIYPGRIVICKCWLLPVGGGKAENLEKNPRSKARNNNKRNPQVATGRNQIQATLGGEHSYYRVISAPIVS